MGAREGPPRRRRQHHLLTSRTSAQQVAVHAIRQRSTAGLRPSKTDDSGEATNRPPRLLRRCRSPPARSSQSRPSAAESRGLDDDPAPREAAAGLARRQFRSSRGRWGPSTGGSATSPRALDASQYLSSCKRLGVAAMPPRAIARRAEPPPNHRDCNRRRAAEPVDRARTLTPPLPARASRCSAGLPVCAPGKSSRRPGSASPSEPGRGEYGVSWIAPPALPSCWRRHLSPTAFAWLPMSAGGSLSADSDSASAAACGPMRLGRSADTRARAWGGCLLGGLDGRV